MKKYYYLGFAVYVFSFFLPAIRMFDAPMKGYACALIIFMGFFEANSFVAYLSALFLNLPNILTLFVFVLHFKFPLQRLFALQALALLSACYWVVYELVKYQDLSSLYIGYWNWVFSLFLMSTVLYKLRKQLKHNEREQEK